MLTEHGRLKQQLVYLLPLVTDANEWSEKLNKKFRYELTILGRHSVLTQGTTQVSKVLYNHLLKVLDQIHF